MATRKAPAGYAPDLPAGCSIRQLRHEDEEAVVDLLLRAFDGAWPRHSIPVPAVDHLRWKLRSDDKAMDLHLAAVLDGTIIAVRPMWVYRLKVGDRLALARFAIDRAVAPEFQRMRLMTALEARTPNEWFDEFDAVLGVWNNWQSINFVPGTPYRRKLDVVARRLDSGPPDVVPSEWNIRNVQSFDERVNVLWDAASANFEFAVARTQGRLNYRYADPRAGDYSIAIAEQGPRLLGYAVSSVSFDAGQIADIFVLPGRDDVLESLLVFAVQQLRDAGATSVECWRDLHHPYGPVLDKLGFAELRRSQGFTLHMFHGRDDEAAFFADPKSTVHIMAGDTDLV